ncbi:MAG: pectate lyase, partial [Alistipes sp.]|nr:pectate lyase [Alistipes sp.]
GGGMYTTGGRGGRVIHVTNLNDSGTGSLRAAVEASGPRVIVFDVAGTIQLKSELRIKNGDVTIAGQTAPGDGITLRDYSVVITSSNVIIRYLRFRMGDAAGHEGDAIWGRYYQDIIIDHCSMSWSTDECASFYGNKNFTMQWCLIGESLRASIHGKGNHGYGGIWGGKNASFHHNILTAHSSRNPRFCHPQVYGNYLSTHRGHVDYRNNVVNNWGDNSSYGGESAQINMVNNLYKPGPASKDRKYFLAADAYYEKDGTVWSSAYPQLYVTGNVHTAHGDITSNNQSGINFTDGAEYANYQKFQSAPFAIKKDDSQVCYTTTQTASKAYDMTLDYAGASLKRDAVDVRLIDDVRNGKATYTTGGNGSTGGMIDTQTAVGGWPTLTATDEEVKRATTDTDKDGIPDYYEEVLGLDKSKSDASQKTLDPQGLYTNFEAYLHFLVQHITSAQTAGGTYTKLE